MRLRWKSKHFWPKYFLVLILDCVWVEILGTYLDLKVCNYIHDNEIVILIFFSFFGNKLYIRRKHQCIITDFVQLVIIEP